MLKNLLSLIKGSSSNQQNSFNFKRMNSSYQNATSLISNSSRKQTLLPNYSLYETLQMQQAQTLEKQNQILERWATNISKNNNLENQKIPILDNTDKGKFSLSILIEDFSFFVFEQVVIDRNHLFA
jgi:hypothetical protein